MTIFLPSPMLQTYAPLVSSDKGSIGNRVKCTGAQYLNVVGTAAGVTASVAGAKYLANHSANVKNIVDNVKAMGIGKSIKNCAQKVGAKLESVYGKTKIWNTGKLASSKAKEWLVKGWKATSNGVYKFGAFFEKLPTGGQVGLGATLLYILARGIYRSGQIDQKYTDRARAQEIAK